MKEKGPAAAEEGLAALKKWGNNMYYLKDFFEVYLKYLDFRAGEILTFQIILARICVTWSIRTSWRRRALPPQRTALPLSIIKIRICITWSIASKQFEIRSILEVLGCHGRRDPCCSKIFEAMTCVIWSIRISWRRRAVPPQRRALPRSIIEARICRSWSIAPKRCEAYLKSLDSMTRKIPTAPNTWSKDMCDLTYWDFTKEEGRAAAEDGPAALNNWSKDI